LSTTAAGGPSTKSDLRTKRDHASFTGMSPMDFGYDPNVEKWTLAEVAERGTLALVPWTHLGQFKCDEHVGAVRRRMRCRRCGAKYPSPIVHLNGVRGSLAWWPMPPSVGR
jgi:hypothetical protein